MDWGTSRLLRLVRVRVRRQLMRIRLGRMRRPGRMGRGRPMRDRWRHRQIEAEERRMDLHVNYKAMLKFSPLSLHYHKEKND